MKDIDDISTGVVNQFTNVVDNVKTSKGLNIKPHYPHYRNIYAIPKHEDFFYLVYDRLDMVLSRFNILQCPFTMIMTGFPRDQDQINISRREFPNSKFLGLDRQKELLFNNFISYGYSKDDIDLNELSKTEHMSSVAKQYLKELLNETTPRNKVEDYKRLLASYDYINNSNVLRQSVDYLHGEFTWSGAISVQYLAELEKSDLALTDVITRFKGSLLEYFSLDETGKPNNFDSFRGNQKLEYHFLRPYLRDFREYYYVSVPLIQFGEIDGIVHIIYHEDDHKRFVKETYREKFVKSELGSQDKNEFSKETNDLFSDVVETIIKSFSNEYEGAILDWDLVGTNKYKESTINDLLNTNFFEKENPNRIFKDLGFIDYYKRRLPYFLVRFSISDEVPKLFIQNYRSTAVITTLLDSYAHNISAHSLITLTAWYRDLSKYLTNPETYTGDSNPLIECNKNRISNFLALEHHRLNEFLLQKGAFWSGITRKTNFSGKRENAYDVLWDDFINNALYLGTIANSEKVNKINIHITIYEKESETKNFINTKTVKKENNTLLDAHFVTIDLNNPDIDRISNNQERAYSVFVKKEAQFEIIKKALKQINLFFPGGVVGKHSFFTLIENEIRNIKHYKNEHLADIQRDGLNLHLSFHERLVDSNNPDSNKAIYKIGVWLGHLVEQLNGDLLLGRIRDLSADIVDEVTFKPKLGGSHQDKICSAQLMTNDFDNAQRRGEDYPLGEIYFPWIKTAGLKFSGGKASKDSVTEFEVSLRKFIDKGEAAFIRLAEEKLNGEGYLKKYFHLWKSEVVFEIGGKSEINLENPARFKFVKLAEEGEKKELYNYLKSELNIVRVLPNSITSNDEAVVYSEWLKVWQKGKINYLIEFKKGGKSVSKDGSLLGVMLHDGKMLRFFNEIDFLNYIEENRRTLRAIPKENMIQIKIAHKSDGKENLEYFNYRSHGYLMNQFAGGQKLSKLKNVQDEDLYRLHEALVTNICIFDRRIYNQICPVTNNAYGMGDRFYAYQRRLELYRNELNLDFRNEVRLDWEDAQKRGFLNYHFLILHLSFIENMKDKNGEFYKEQGIARFIKERILGDVSPENISDNFVLVITTGRGRIEWWENIKDTELARFTTFRPIESINAAISDALEIGDDIDLKINLAKILFGS